MQPTDTKSKEDTMSDYEYDSNCEACEADADHSAKEHARLIARRNKRESERLDRLYRQARHDYERA